MEEFLNDMDFKKALKKASKKFVEEDIRSDDVGRLMYKFCIGLFESLGIKVKLFVLC